MECSEFKESLGLKLSDEAKEHATDCAPCRELAENPELVRLLSKTLHTDTPPLSLSADKMSAIVGQESGPIDWVRSRSTAKRVSFLLLSVTTLILGILVLGGRIDWPEYPRWRMGFELGLLSTLVIVAVRVVLRPLYLPRLRFLSVWTMLGLSACIPILFAILPVAHQAHPSSLAGLGSDLVPRALGCFRFGTIFAVASVAVLFLVSRNPAASGRLGLVAACAGIIGVFSLQVHCPLTGKLHIFWGHTSVALVMIFTGLFFSIFLPLRTSKNTSPG